MNWFDEIVARDQAQQDVQDARERAMREQMGQEGAIAWERLKAILRGEKPTRESMAEWQARKAGEAAAQRPSRRSHRTDAKARRHTKLRSPRPPSSSDNAPATVFGCAAVR